MVSKAQAEARLEWRLLAETRARSFGQESLVHVGRRQRANAEMQPGPVRNPPSG